MPAEPCQYGFEATIPVLGQHFALTPCLKPLPPFRIGDQNDQEHMMVRGCVAVSGPKITAASRQHVDEA